MKRLLISIIILTVWAVGYSQEHCSNNHVSEPNLILLNDSSSSYIKIEKNDEGDYRVSGKVINYSYGSFQGEEGTIPCLIKSEKESTNWMFGSSHEILSKITLTIYPDYFETAKFSYTKDAQVFELRDDYLFAATYGCCDNPSYFELSTFPHNITFLKSSKRFCIIDIPNSNKSIYVGFCLNKDSASLAEGLYGSLFYSINQKPMQEIPFKIKNKEDKLSPVFTLELFSQNENDIVNSENPDYDYMYAFSLNGELAPIKYSGIGVRMKFYEAKKRKSRTAQYELMFDKGKIAQKEVIIDLDEKK